MGEKLCGTIALQFGSHPPGSYGIFITVVSFLLFGHGFFFVLDVGYLILVGTRICLVKAIVFPVVMYGCESWTVKKAELQRIDAFKLWCWRRLLDCKEIQPVHSEGDQPWDFFGRNDAKAETLVLWPPHVKS